MKRILLPCLFAVVATTGAFSAGAATFSKYQPVATPQQAAARVASQKLTLSYPIAAYYTASDHDYYLIVANKEDVTYDTQTGNLTATDAWALKLDLYATDGAASQLPVGTYKASTDYSNFTYDSEYTTLIQYDIKGNVSNVINITGDITVSMDDSKSYTISFEQDIDGVGTAVTYTGKLPLSDGTSSIYPSVKEDMSLNFTGGSAYYYGNLMENNTGNMIVRLFDCEFDSESGNITSDAGNCLNIMLFSRLFASSATKRLVAGTYTCARTLNRETWYPGMEVDYMSYTIPYGTYVQAKDSKYSGGYAYGYLVDGTVVIEELGNDDYRITVNGTTNLSYTVSGTFEGTISDIEDRSDDESTSSISTLTDDVEMDLSPIEICRAYNGGDFKDKTIQSFILDIGSPSGKDEGIANGGDLIRMEFLLPYGIRKIQPGTYSVLDNDYETYFQPYSLRQGYFSKKGTGELVGTRYNHIKEGSYVVFDEYAPAASGSVGVILNADDTYTFKISLVDDAGYYITGEWTGPMQLNYNPSALAAGIESVEATAATSYFLAGGQLTFSAPTAYAIYSLQGVELLSGHGESADLSALADGVYIMQFDNKTVKISKK